LGIQPYHREIREVFIGICALPIPTLSFNYRPSMNLLFQITTKAFVFSVVVVVVVVVVAVAVAVVYMCFCVSTCFVSSQKRLALQTTFLHVSNI